VVYVIDGLSMAFEGVFLFLRGWRRVEILYGDPTFYRGGCVSCFIVLRNKMKNDWKNERYKPSPLGMQASDLVMYFKLLSLS
jgi:hypothetical protein